LRRGNRFDPLGQVGSREALRQQPLDRLPVLPRRGFQQFVGVLGCQVRGQQDDRAQVQPPVGDRREDGGILPCRARCPDALEGGLFAQPHLMDAVGVHRGMRRRQVELPRIELGNMREESCRAGAISRRCRNEVAGQDGVGNVAQ